MSECKVIYEKRIYLYLFEIIDQNGDGRSQHNDSTQPIDIFKISIAEC